MTTGRCLQDNEEVFSADLSAASGWVLTRSAIAPESQDWPQFDLDLRRREQGVMHEALPHGIQEAYRVLGRERHGAVHLNANAA